MPVPRLTAREIAYRGETLYEEKLRAIVEKDNTGKFLIIEVYSGDYEIDADETIAFNRAFRKNPEGLVYIMRIGYSVAHHIGPPQL